MATNDILLEIKYILREIGTFVSYEYNHKEYRGRITSQGVSYNGEQYDYEIAFEFQHAFTVYKANDISSDGQPIYLYCNDNMIHYSFPQPLYSIGAKGLNEKDKKIGQIIDIIYNNSYNIYMYYIKSDEDIYLIEESQIKSNGEVGMMETNSTELPLVFEEFTKAQLKDFDICVTKNNIIYFADIANERFVSEERWESFKNYTEDLMFISDLDRDLDIYKIYRTGVHISFELLKSHFYKNNYEQYLLYNREDEVEDENNKDIISPQEWTDKQYKSYYRSNSEIIRIGNKISCVNLSDPNLYATIVYNNEYSIMINSAIVYALYKKEKVYPCFKYTVVTEFPPYKEDS